MIGYRNRGTTLTGLTLVETDGTVTISGGKILMSGKSGAEAATLGFYRSMGTLGVGAKFYWQIKPTVENIYCVYTVMTYAVLSDPGGYDGNAIRSGQNRDNLGAFHANTVAGGNAITNAGNDTADFGEVTDLQIHYTDSDAQIDFFHRRADDPGDLDPTSATAWTEWAAGSRYSVANNLIGDTVYLAMSKWGVAGNLEIDDIYYLTDGTFTPPTPTTLAVTSETDDTIALSWTDIATAVNADGISIEVSDSGGAYSEADTVAIGVGTFSNGPGLRQGAHYSYRVRAFVDVGGVIYYGAYSNVVSGTTTMAAPTSLTATAVSSSQIDLTWTSNSFTYEDGFVIERSLSSGSGFTEIGRTITDDTTYSDTTALPSTLYYYRVRAFTDNTPPEVLGDVSGEASDTTEAAPASSRATCKVLIAQGRG